MSLFKVRDWWSTCCGANENFDTNCLCIGNVSNHPSKTNQILVGSHSGMLRVYQPSCLQQEDGSFEGYKPEHVLLECQMSQAILGLSFGRFVSGSEKLYIALLHPRKLAIYSLTGKYVALLSFAPHIYGGTCESLCVLCLIARAWLLDVVHHVFFAVD